MHITTLLVVCILSTRVGIRNIHTYGYTSLFASSDKPGVQIYEHVYCPNLDTGGSRGVGRARRAPREKVPPQLPAGGGVSARQTLPFGPAPLHIHPPACLPLSQLWNSKFYLVPWYRAARSVVAFIRSAYRVVYTSASTLCILATRVLASSSIIYAYYSRVCIVCILCTTEVSYHIMHIRVVVLCILGVRG